MRIGIDLGGTKIEGAALDDMNRLHFRRRVPTPSGDYEATLRGVADLARAIEAHVAEGAARCSVGIGIPGTISPTTRLVKNANSICLIGRPLDQDLERLLDRPVRIANDADCFALSEATDGAAAGAGIAFGAILGTGVGAGIVVGGRPLSGANAIAGEWGHNPLPEPGDDKRPGPICYCGRRGCIETFLSGPALARDHAAATGRDLEPAAIAVAASRGDRGAEASLRRYEDRFARALGTIVNIIDPDAIVLGGGLSNMARLPANVRARLPRYVFSDHVTTRIVPASHGDASGVRGAVWLWRPGEWRP
ncbi:MAG: ROK family protein [Alphaproteobacteria bacterium]|nr:ROK family protein [Alphaproteobacteria bacterium]